MRNRLAVNIASIALAVRLAVSSGVLMASGVLKLWGSPEHFHKALAAVRPLPAVFFPPGFSYPMLAGIWRLSCPEEVRR